MGYSIKFSKEAQKTLKKMDKFQSKLIMNWIKNNLLNTNDPRQHGKGLSANKAGFWRYRVGDYRIIADIEDEELIILIIKVGHRRKIYD